MSVRFKPYRMFFGAFIPEWLMRSSAVSSGAKLTYARLCRYAGKDGAFANPRLEELAEEIAVSKRSVQNYLAELEEAGLIEAEQVGLNQPNRYYFLWSSMIDGDEVGVAEVATPEWQTSATQDRQDPATPSSLRESASESSSRASRRDVEKPAKASRKKRPAVDSDEGQERTGSLPDDAEPEPTNLRLLKPRRGWTTTTLVESFTRRALAATDVPTSARDTVKGALGTTLKKWQAEGTATPDEIAKAMETFFLAPATRLHGEATLWLAFVNHYPTIAQQASRPSLYDTDHYKEPSLKNTLAGRKRA